jgi:hypothetical protein
MLNYLYRTNVYIECQSINFKKTLENQFIYPVPKACLPVGRGVN